MLFVYNVSARRLVRLEVHVQGDVGAVIPSHGPNQMKFRRTSTMRWLFIFNNCVLYI